MAVDATSCAGCPEEDGSQNVNSEAYQNEVAEFATLLEDTKKKAEVVSVSIETVKDRLEGRESNTAKGLTYLEMKNHLLLSYLLDVTHLIWKKICGRQIAGERSIKRLVEVRTVLERIRPIDQKLKYQIDKLVRTAAIGVINADDPLHFKANPSALQAGGADEGSEADSADESAEKSKKTRAYVPPKLAPVHYEGAETEKERRERILDRAKRWAVSSSIIEELRKEYYDGPQEMSDAYGSQKATESKLMRQRTEYEEDNMLRISLNKKEMAKAKQLGTMSQLGSLTRFGNISALNAEDLEELEPKKKKAKQVYKKKWSKKGFRKGKH